MFTLKVKDKHYRIPDQEKLRQLFEAGKIAEDTQIYERATQQWVTVGDILGREQASVEEDAPLRETDEYARTVMAGEGSYARPKPAADFQPKMTLSDAAFRYDEAEDGATPTAEMHRVDTESQGYDPSTQFGNVEFDSSRESYESETEETSTQSDAWGSAPAAFQPSEQAEVPVAMQPALSPAPLAAPAGATPRIAQPVATPAPNASGKGVIFRYFGFDILVSSAIIKAVYIFGVLGITLATVGLLAAGDGARQMLGPEAPSLPIPAAAAIFFLVSQIFWRIICEVMILAFSIHDHLVAVEKKLNEK